MYNVTLLEHRMVQCYTVKIVGCPIHRPFAILVTVVSTRTKTHNKIFCVKTFITYLFIYLFIYGYKIQQLI